MSLSGLWRGVSAPFHLYREAEQENPRLARAIDVCSWAAWGAYCAAKRFNAAPVTAAICAAVAPAVICAARHILGDDE